ncbi:hypothetical protein Gorai_003882 [Gossypium raimondii]|uniref:Uncharacterized protein n=1 Tax=Gossypium raimondii TaxID=29730 RepID=A0A7J8QHD2_GOSRA|nr:hypothetical protein [Gossypium raimondii]
MNLEMVKFIIGAVTSSAVKGRGSRFKSGQIRSGKRLNRIIKDRGQRFKVAENSKVPLTDSMNIIAELIRARLSTKVRPVIGSTK